MSLIHYLYPLPRAYLRTTILSWGLNQSPDILTLLLVFYDHNFSIGGGVSEEMVTDCSFLQLLMPFIIEAMRYGEALLSSFQMFRNLHSCSIMVFCYCIEMFVWLFQEVSRSPLDSEGLKNTSSFYYLACCQLSVVFLIFLLSIFVYSWGLIWLPFSALSSLSDYIVLISMCICIYIVLSGLFYINNDQWHH